MIVDQLVCPHATIHLEVPESYPSGIIFILAPLPDIPAHIIQTELIGREATDGRGVLKRICLQ